MLNISPKNVFQHFLVFTKPKQFWLIDQSSSGGREGLEKCLHFNFIEYLQIFSNKENTTWVFCLWNLLNVS